MRFQNAVVYSLIFCYCIIVSSENVHSHSEDSDENSEGRSTGEIGISLPSPPPIDDGVPPTHSTQDTPGIRGTPQCAINIDSINDTLREMSERFDRILSISEQQLKRLDSLETRYTELKEQTQAQIGNIDRKLHEISRNGRESQDLLNNVISTIGNGSSHSTPETEMDTKDKLETLQVSVQDVRSSIGSLLDELSTIRRNITNVANITSELDQRNIKMETVLETVEADTVLLKEGLQQTHNDISSISNGISCDNQSRCQFEMETKNKLETLQVSVRDVRSSIGSVRDELLTIERAITNVANITSELDRRNINMETVLDTVKADTVLLKEGLHQTHNDISSISNGSSCDDHPTLKTVMEAKNKLETLQASFHDVRLSIGSVVDELPRIKRSLRSVADITSESLRQNKKLPTMEYFNTKTMELKDTTISEVVKITKKLSQYETPPADCWDALQNGYNSSGIYKIQPPGTICPFDVYCNMETHGGGWTVFQNRNNGEVNFTRKWQEYKQGFGDPPGDYWLGLENVYRMTNHKDCEMLIEVKASNSTQFFALYDKFTIGSGFEGYQIKELGDYSGTAGDAMKYSDGKKFSTTDVDNDTWIDGNCADLYNGGWWYGSCSACNINGHYPELSRYDGSFYWTKNKDRYALMETQMSIRPRNRLQCSSIYATAYDQRKSTTKLSLG